MITAVKAAHRSMIFTYTSHLRTEIETALSTDRLSTYRTACAVSLEGAIDLYVWNAAVAAAFFGPIGVLEVCLRNGLDRQLARRFSNPWYDDPAFLGIDPNFSARIQRAKSKLSARGAPIARSRLIAELSFGFWVNLLRPGPGGAYARTLWGPVFSKAFRRGTRRATVAGHLDRVLRFRNRVAHHEPIFRHDLPEQYRSILWIIDQVAPSLVPWVEHHTRIYPAITDGPAPPRFRF